MSRSAESARRRVLIVDDHPIVRHGLARMIEASPDLAVCGEVETVALGVAEDVLVVIPRGKYESLQARMNLPSLLVAPVEAGQAVGSVRVELDDKLLIERPLVAISGAPEGGIWRRMVDGFWLWFEDDEAAE